jgi:hypothetical protein
MDSTSSSPQFYQCKYGRVRLLTVDNYADWSTSLINFLKADRTWKIVQGDEKAPDPLQLPANAAARARANAQEEYQKALNEFESKAAKACSLLHVVDEGIHFQAGRWL